MIVSMSPGSSSPDQNDKPASDPPQVTWGINRWVMIELDSRVDQRQVHTKSELNRFLLDFGISGSESSRLAETAWHERPETAEETEPSSTQGLRRGFGASTWFVAAVVVLLVATPFILWLLDGYGPQ